MQATALPEPERSLRAASDRLLDEIAVPLHKCLAVHPRAMRPNEFVDTASGSGDDMPAEFIVYFELFDSDECAEKIAPALRAAVRLINHSNRLRASPRLKASLWRRVMRSALMADIWHEEADENDDEEPRNEDTENAPRRLAHGIQEWMLEREAFPRVYLNVVFRENSLSERVLNALSDAMTTVSLPEPVEFIDPSSSLAGDTTPWGFDLRFSDCSLSSTQMELFERFLASVSAHPDRKWMINLVEMSLVNTAPELRVLAEIFKKNDELYKISELELRLTCQSGDPNNVGERATDSLLRAIFDVPRGCPLSALRSVDLSHTPLRAQQFATICSALRYRPETGIASFSSCISTSLSPRERDQCWRWLAFGLFHPVSKRFVSDNGALPRRRVDLSCESMRFAGAEAFGKTLLNPAELVLHRNTKEDTNATVDALRVVTIKKGAMLYVEPETSSEILMHLEGETAFESLCVENGTWACAVLPARGLGWVQLTDVLRFDDDEESSCDEANPVIARYDLVLSEVIANRRSPQALCLFLKPIGPYLRSLDMSLSSFTAQNCAILRWIVKRSVKLKHLSIQFSMYPDEVMALLVEALRGDLGQQLLSLKLSATTFLNANVIETFTALLENPEELPALQELRMHVDRMSTTAMRSLAKGLEVHKKLAIVDLRLPHSTAFGGGAESTRAMTREEFLAANQRRLLSVKPLLSMEQSVAFLSVVYASGGLYDEHAAELKAIHCLDQTVMSMIFKFIGKEIRRKVILNN
ncbi:hypothetical protein Gpo141_00001783 [Globisporangium polare]